MEEIRLAKAVFEESQPLQHARPSPIRVARREHLDLKHIAGFRSFYPYRPCERMDARAIDGQELRNRGAWANLAAA